MIRLEDLENLTKNMTKRADLAVFIEQKSGNIWRGKCSAIFRNRTFFYIISKTSKQWWCYNYSVKWPKSMFRLE